MSIRSRILNTLVSILLSRWSKGTIEEQRTRQERMAKFNPVPRGIRRAPAAINDLNSEWIGPESPEEGVIVYLHGGAYTLGSVSIHRELISRIAIATGIGCLAINYRLAPEHPFPAALEDSCNAYRWLTNGGTLPEKIVLAGDSAGGGLVLSTLVKLRDEGLPLPAGAVCISPWTDLTLSGASVQSEEKHDPMLSASRLHLHAQSYAGGLDLSAPLISPLFADLSDLPPILIHVGTNEILLDDATRFADRARQFGVDIGLRVWDGMIHVFPMFSFFNESKLAIECMAEFIGRCIEEHGAIP